MRRFVAALAIARLAAVTLVALPTQMLAVRRGWRLSRRLPIWWHRNALAAMGVRVSVHGAPVADRPLLVTPNHVSWLDIPVIASLMPISFVAKSEVATWPLFGLFAKLQRSVFVDRTRRTATGRATGELAGRLAAGDCMVLFPEGTSSTGDVVLPFRSALLGAARAAIDEGGATEVWVQPLTVAYTRIAGMPIGRAERPRVGWTGDVDLPPHLWGIFTAGGIDVEIVWGRARPFDTRTDRKALAVDLESAVRADLLGVLRP
ncbi:lysophospholipid acyltransferase family protein [Pinisolibacter aquiterrae]|uniref:lysophospholipid acyltransferase family protein n=1 Tax=Pinisolibacter aquiterrae TaxID=2815579 RepID=UPI001C3D35DF|nr:lysophospholipid acyltransferase family protein [Pinisolibacter aquiterrae]MBV5266130.1 1-acyl-sn-glycerol-3-phosphate acyltransferase [Pinisolibacter aquiterrae]MCC8236218.1 1-acyl-sn-glycerol-3-phosphate acyltransferase [Pinisolibacter aquiterrae]